MSSNIELWCASLDDVMQVLAQPPDAQQALFDQVRAGAPRPDFGRLFSDEDQDTALREVLARGPYTLSDATLYWAQLGCICRTWSWARDASVYSFRLEDDLREGLEQLELSAELPGQWLDTAPVVDVDLPDASPHNVHWLVPEAIPAIQQVWVRVRDLHGQLPPNPGEELGMLANFLLDFLDRTTAAQRRARDQGRAVPGVFLQAG